MFEGDSASTVMAKKVFNFISCIALIDSKLAFFPFFGLSLLNCMMYNPNKVTGSKQHSKLRELLGPTNGLHVSSSCSNIKKQSRIKRLFSLLAKFLVVKSFSQ